MLIARQFELHRLLEPSHVNEKVLLHVVVADVPLRRLGAVARDMTDGVISPQGDVHTILRHDVRRAQLNEPSCGVLAVSESLALLSGTSVLFCADKAWRLRAWLL